MRALPSKFRILRKPPPPPVAEPDILLSDSGSTIEKVVRVERELEMEERMREGGTSLSPDTAPESAEWSDKLRLYFVRLKMLTDKFCLSQSVLYIRSSARGAWRSAVKLPSVNSTTRSLPSKR